jgi:hypothetical protein
MKYEERDLFLKSPFIPLLQRGKIICLSINETLFAIMRLQRSLSTTNLLILNRFNSFLIYGINLALNRRISNSLLKMQMFS